MPNKNYVGHQYFCAVCKFTYTMTEELLDEVQLSHANGESLTVITALCPACESFSIPEGMNQLTFLMDQK